MKYRVTIDGQLREVDVVVAPDGTITATLDGRRRALDVLRVPGGLSLRLDGRMYDIATGGPPEAMQVAAGSARAVAEVESDRMLARKQRGGGALGGGGGDALNAPMPGRVVKVLVSKGQAVELDEPCVVIEAMKMENELRAPRAGTVAEVLVSEGANVDGGTVLVRFE